MFKLRLTQLLMLTLLSLSAIADELEIFDLKGATPQEIIPLIKPFVGPEGSVNGMHNKLIIRTSADRMTQVRKILQEFDRAPRRLLIHVRDTAPSEVERSHIDLSIDQPHLQIGEKEKNRLRIKRYTTETQEANLRTLQTIEGQPTLISSGIIRPEVTRNGYITGPRGGYQTNIDYRAIDSGFYATIQVTRDRVRIEISTRKQTEINDSPAVATQTTGNVVSGQIGEWLPLATTHSQRRQKSTAIGSHTSSESMSEYQIWVKVELLPE